MRYAFHSGRFVVALHDDWGGGPTLKFKFTTIDVPQAQAPYLLGVNNSGIMVGPHLDSGGQMHGFQRVGSKFTTLDDPDGNSTSCYGINSKGHTVGA